MFSYYNLIKNIAVKIASTSGITEALKTADQENRDAIIHLGYDFNKLPSSDDQPVLIVLPSASPIDSGNGITNLGEDFNEQNPSVYIQWQFTNDGITTTSGVTIQDGLEHVDTIGRLVVDTVKNYVDTLGYQVSYCDYDTTISECFPTFSGAAVISLRGLRTLGTNPFEEL